MRTRENYDWWSSLRHGGLLIAPGKLDQYFPAVIEPMPRRQVDQLRRDLTRFQPGDRQSLAFLLATVLEDVLGLDRRLWFKGNNVDKEWSHTAITGEVIRPRRVWVDAHDHALPVFVDTGVKRIGIGRGRRSVSRVVEWLRRADRKIALLTNGRQWRLIHAGSDHDAWAESDTDQWFEEGQPGPQVDALRILLNPFTLSSDADDKNPPLLEAIQATRQGQAELSTELGERVRRAVELLIHESTMAIDSVRAQTEFTNNDLYIAANRIVMRLVIILFAEARDLLPRDNVSYHNSYGLQGLRELLDRLAGGRAQERLRHSYSTWPRLLALFRLMYYGSYHESLPIPTYGGQLFAPGDLNARKPIDRSLVAFEQIDPCPSDAAVYRILEFLTKSKIKVRQGNRNTWVDAPVDFSDLSTEYIGILYQGLLDFELRQAVPDEPMIFLNLGDQPVLPLSRLEDMEDEALAALVEKLKTKSKPAAAAVEESDEEAADDLKLDEEETDEEETQDEEPAPEKDEEESDDVIRQLRERALNWAIRAVKVGKLVFKPRSRSREALATYENDAAAYAPRLIARIILPGEWFLVRWGGTRKGSGTFYTRPGLGVPLVRRTLQPLAYEQKDDAWLPRLPEEILELKVCDSAMGSGSLLVAALRYLTDALYESLFYFDRIKAHGEQGICRLADGQLTDEVIEESLPIPPEHPEFEDRLKARLKRYIVERCVYGVDLNPLAVELARLSLWIETMDPRLPFSFLDHKLKSGNSLVGCWLDQFQDYPLMAWEREGGDKKHGRFVHHYHEYIITRGKHKGKEERRGDKWTQAIKDMRNNVIRPEMTVLIQSLGTRMMRFGDAQTTAKNLHAIALQVFERMHQLALTNPSRQAEVYREELQNDPAYCQLKLAFDNWCAIWFWPGSLIAEAPAPLNFQNLPESSASIVQRIEEEIRFFHWELEFPDVFNQRRKGFDATIQNPPWDIQKPNSLEFFSNFDPLYRSYGKQEALRQQANLFVESPEIEEMWLSYKANFRALSNWTKHAAFPFGDDKEGGNGFSLSKSPRNSKKMHKFWRDMRKARSGFVAVDHPFRHQGSADINTYKLFLELALRLINERGRIGILSPSGVHSDLGTVELRKQWLPRLSILAKFDNEKKIFDGLHHGARFDLLVLDSKETRVSKGAFFSWRDASVLEELEKYWLDVSLKFVKLVSPSSLSIPELRSKMDRSIVEKIYQDGELIPEFWQPYSEFHMTNDSSLFKGSEMPVYQGGMIWLHDHRFNYYDKKNKKFVRKRSGNVDLRLNYPLQAKYWTTRSTYENKFGGRKLNGFWHYQFYRIAYRVQSSSANQRTFIATIIPPGCATGNSLATLVSQDYVRLLLLLSFLTSLTHDFNVRTKIAFNINSFYFPQFVIPKVDPGSRVAKALILNTLRLISTSAIFTRLYDQIADQYLRIDKWTLTSFAATSHERKRLTAVNDALVFESFGLRRQDAEHIVSSFPGVESDIPSELRYPILSLIAFYDLKDKGLETFLAQNNGEGWMIPETLRLADYGLGHDAPAKEYQPVASRLGPRVLPWQLEGAPEQSWEECELHADNLQLLLGKLTSDNEEINNSMLTSATSKFFREHNQTTEPTQLNIFDNTDPQY